MIPPASIALLLVGTLVVGCAGFGGHWAGSDTAIDTAAAEGAAAGGPAEAPGSLWVPRLNEVVAAMLGRMLEVHEAASGAVAPSPVGGGRATAATCAAPSE